MDESTQMVGAWRLVRSTRGDGDLGSIFAVTRALGMRSAELYLKRRTDAPERLEFWISDRVVRPGARGLAEHPAALIIDGRVVERVTLSHLPGNEFSFDLGDATPAFRSGQKMDICTSDKSGIRTCLSFDLAGSAAALDHVLGKQSVGSRATAGDGHVREFIKEFITKANRELPGYIHKELKYLTVDLNGDGRNDVIVLGNSPAFCGSAGCTMFVYLAEPNGQFREVYAKQSQNEDFPSVGPERVAGYTTLTFPYAAIGDRVVHQVAVWRKDGYQLSHYLDGDIRIAPIDERRQETIRTDGVLRERPSQSAKRMGGGNYATLGSVENREGSWAVRKECNGCAFGYARILP